MRVGICEWTTFPATFEAELAAYRAAGAGVELMSDDGTFGNAFEDSLGRCRPKSSRGVRSRAWRPREAPCANRAPHAEGHRGTPGSPCEVPRLRRGTEG